MNEIRRAISLLEEVRRILAERLAAQLVESSEDVLDDARGLSYMGEIHTLYDQIGQGLSYVNIMLAGLSVLKDQAPAAAIGPEEALAAGQTDVKLEGDVSNDTSDDDSSSDMDLTTEVPPPRTSTPFANFISHLEANDVDGAAGDLSALFGVGEADGRRLTAAFLKRQREEETLPQKVPELSESVRRGRINQALMLLWECFGVQGIEAISLVSQLGARFNEASPGDG